MKRFIKRVLRVSSIIIATFVFLNSSAFTQSKTSPSLNIDHINIAVKDLSKARIPLERLGFTIKSGRVHSSTINNLHIKFQDGTEIELITVTKPADDLAEEYYRLINKGEGGAFLALRTKSLQSFTETGFVSKYPFELGTSMRNRSLVFDSAHPLRPIWFIEVENPNIDNEKYTSHKNTAMKFEAVWLSNRI